MHRGLPDAVADDDQRVRAGRRQPHRPDLHQDAAARPAAARAWSSRRTRCGSARPTRTTTWASATAPRPSAATPTSRAGSRHRDRGIGGRAAAMDAWRRDRATVLAATSHRRGRHLLGARPAGRDRRGHDGAVPQRGARGAVPGRRDAHPGRALRRAGRPVPGRRAGDRLHRRDPHAVPVRAHARRRRLERLAHRDAARPAGRRRSSSGSASPACSWATIASAVVHDDGRWPAVGLGRANAEGNVVGIARLLFTDYLFAFEVTSALLITAALGAMVLAHKERTEPKITQRELARLRFTGRPPVAAARPGRVRRHELHGDAGPAARRHRGADQRQPGPRAHVGRARGARRRRKPVAPRRSEGEG